MRLMNPMNSDPKISEIRPSLFRLDTPLGERVVSLYLIVGQDQAIMFDAGVLGTIPSFVLPMLEQIGIPPESITYVIISHCDIDHFGGIEDIRNELPRAEILAHAKDRRAMEDFEVFLNERGQGFAKEYGFRESEEAIEWMRSLSGAGPIAHGNPPS